MEFKEQNPSLTTSNVNLHHHFIDKMRIAPTLFLIIGIIFGIGLDRIYQMQKQPKPTITVTGNGTVDAPADKAIIRASISTQNTDIQTAQNDNKKMVQQVKTALYALGISDSWIQTTTYTETPRPSIYPYNPYQLQPINPPPFPTNTGNGSYTINTTIAINLKNNNLNQADKVINALTAVQGITLNGGTQYMLSDDNKYQSQAEKKALIDAKQKMDTIAKINTITVGRVVSIKDVTNKSTFMIKQIYISPGETTAHVSASYEVVYELN